MSGRGSGSAGSQRGRPSRLREPELVDGHNGHDAQYVYGQGLGGAPDDRISALPRAAGYGGLDHGKSANGLLGLSGSYWEAYRAGWMRDAYLARYGMQDIHTLRGRRFLTEFEKAIFAACLEEHMRVEFSPKKGNIDD